MNVGSRRAAVAFALAVAMTTVACAPVTSRTTYPPIGSTPQPAGDATAAATQTVLRALAAAGLQAGEATRTFRPPEGPLLAAAPRSILQVALPDDPDHGFIVIYALDSPSAALVAANDHAAWVASSIGRVNFAPGTQFVLRALGANVISFSWLPGSSPDPGLDRIGATLESIGDGVSIPS